VEVPDKVEDVKEDEFDAVEPQELTSVVKVMVRGWYTVVVVVCHTVLGGPWLTVVDVVVCVIVLVSPEPQEDGASAPQPLAVSLTEKHFVCPKFGWI
jgi:hypothetical protein